MSRQARGYDRSYDRLRSLYQADMNNGVRYLCWRCERRIDDIRDWHLGHDDKDRTVIRGPEHPKCNLAAAGRKSVGKREPEAHPNRARR